MKSSPALASLVVLAGCATATPPKRSVDLSAARAKIAEAETAGAERLAPEPLARAVGHLQEAQDAASSAPSGDAAEALVRLSATEAEWATSLAVVRNATSPPQRCEEADSGRGDLEVRLRRAEDEERYLEERISFLTKELDLTQTEVARTKAKIKGQTKAEASSAIAEARILLRRMVDEGVKSPNLPHCQELVNLAENLLNSDNVAGAVFFAMTAQDLIEKTRMLAADPSAFDRRPAKDTYVASAVLNIRKNPGTSEAVVGRIPRGASVEASTQRGDWIFVKHEAAEGWVYAPLLQ